MIGFIVTLTFTSCALTIYGAYAAKWGVQVAGIATWAVALLLCGIAAVSA